jgi:hypothetical protein
MYDCVSVCESAIFIAKLRLIVTAYRFYLLNHSDHITKVHIAECAGVDDIQRTALSLLAEHEAAAAVEAWERDKLVSRTDRPKRDPVTSAA